MLEGRAVGAYTFDAGQTVVVCSRGGDGEKVLGFLGMSLGPDVAQGAGNHAKIVPEEYDNKYLEALKDGVSKGIWTRVGAGPIRTNDMQIRTDGLSNKM